MNLPADHSLVCSFFIIILFLHEAQPSSLLRSVSTPFFFLFLKSTKHVLLWQILNVMTHLAEIRASEPRNNSKNNSTNFTRGRMGQIPVIRCFVQNFYMAAYCIRNLGWASRARVRFVVPVILSVVGAYPTALIVSAIVHCCGGRDSTRVAKCYPAVPSRAALNLDKVFEDAKI